jgi:ElaB/YqjD/DUF883 family membrane-anchored ribosome-binding protein
MESLTAAARANPVGAALVTGGALWLLLGDGGLKSIGGGLAAAAEPVVDLTTRNIRKAAGHGKTPWEDRRNEHIRETAGDLRDTAKSAMHAASKAASSTISSLQDTVDSGTSSVRDALDAMPDVRYAARQTYGKAQSSLAEALEHQPLLLGAIGLAIGAMAAGAFESTRTEKEWFGPVSEDLKSRAQRRGGALSQSLREAADTVSNQANEVAEEALARVRDAGADAIEAARTPRVVPIGRQFDQPR